MVCSRFAGFAMVALACIAAVCANHVHYNWTVQDIENVNPDGLHPRRAIGINGQWPPPPISVNSTDKLTVNVTNGLESRAHTTLHSHGIFFNRTNFFDGASMITQCPIPAGWSMKQDILNSDLSPNETYGQQWGTYWAHSHYRGQYVDGFRTPLVIHNADGEAYAYDDDYVVTLGDWYHQSHAHLNKTKFMVSTNPGGDEPVPKSHLMYFQHVPANGEAKNLDGFNENATLPFQPGKTYRLRIINMSALAMFHFWIEGHDMKIIEVDGVDVQAFPVDFVSIAAAQRVSVLVHARASDDSNWKIHAAADPDMYDDIPKTLKLNTTSTLSYGDNKPFGHGRAFLDNFPLFDDTVLVPLRPIAPYQVAKHSTRRVDIDFTAHKNGLTYAGFNNITFQQPLVPSLFTMKSMGMQAMDPRMFGPNGHAVVAKHMETVELVLYNWDDGSHPFHMHGTQFQITHRSMNVSSPDPSINPPRNVTKANPVRRDTVQVPALGSITIRFIADNPGAWFFHCHIDWHLTQGLAMLVIQAPDIVQNEFQIPAALYEQCKAHGLPSEGNAGGKWSATDFGHLPRPPMLNQTVWHNGIAY
ncbi:hypothetical protein MVES1_003531 [Malassezia vespertilionis]|uniref:uncharacterized protein n=1 Tax=Malassezia vespertilionis TaxID=2020962 RepID=UPI0024B15FE1|nr:uncharacterized protein MVES1_003531 [Malassezia vespertilionis]WFD08160.1 hypothetical protein MVES1_003531 [Malassezia vespertilionis]